MGSDSRLMNVHVLQNRANRNNQKIMIYAPKVFFWAFIFIAVFFAVAIFDVIFDLPISVVFFSLDSSVQSEQNRLTVVLFFTVVALFVSYLWSKRCAVKKGQPARFDTTEHKAGVEDESNEFPPGSKVEEIDRK